MTNEEKILLVDYIIRYLQEKVSSDDMPVMVGVLNEATGLNGFKKAEVGHPVFAFKDRYIIYLESDDGKTTVSVPYCKETLKKYIEFR